jgi:hypothetical protein
MNRSRNKAMVGGGRERGIESVSMGQMRFYAPTPDQLPPEAVQRAYLAGLEGVPWPSLNRWQDGQLIVQRETDESGCLYIPWQIGPRGQLVLSTGNLMEQARPYCLVTELARGSVHRARGLAAEIRSADISLPDEAARLLGQALDHFLDAVTAQECRQQAAQRAIDVADRAITQMCRALSEQTFAQYHAQSHPAPGLLACRLDSSVPVKAAAFLQAFNGAMVPFRWRQLQPHDDRLQWEAVDAQVAWCRQHQLRIFGGPLVQLDPLTLPDWVYLWKDDYDAFENHALRYIDRVVRRFENEVDVWICAGRLNMDTALGLSEEEKLRLAVAAVETVRRASPRTPVVVSFDQPWAEYLVREPADLSPLHFADALVRADLGVAGIAVEMNLGYWPHGVLPRDLLEIVRHVDRWSLLGIPLIVLLTMPEHGQQDPQAQGPSSIVPRDRAQPQTPAVDQSLARDLIPLLYTRPRIHAVAWNQWSDAFVHEFPNSGLLEASGSARPLLQWLVEFRQQHLG